MSSRATPGHLQLFAGIALISTLLGPWHAAVEAQRRVQHLSGQNVAPVYDGYEANPDGTYSLWFGYFNRNQEEAVDIPIGPDNRFEPGQEDRGQPTHFVPQWQKSSFRVIVPKDFGEQKITWRLTVKGKTETVSASLDRRSIIDRQATTLENTAGLNKAPTVTIEPSAQTIARGTAAALTVAATDDGLPLNQRSKKPEGLTVRWRKYRGPVSGQVTFDPASALLVDARSGTRASFSEPGEYVVQAVVDDGSLMAGTYCCWVSREVRITVK
jgi:hypothetical protein